MNKLLIGFSFFLVSNICFAEQANKNTVLNYVYYDDFKTWLTGGKSLYDWSPFVNKDKVITSQIYAPHSIYNEFDNNVYAASKKYNVVPTHMRGIVYSVKADNSNNPIVTFSAGLSDYFYAKGFEEDEVTNLKRGTQFEFVCYKFDYDGFILKSNQCTTLRTYYGLVSLGLYNEIDTSKLEQNSPHQIGNLILKNIPKEDLSSFNNECGKKSLEDSKCLKKAAEISAKAFKVSQK